MRLKLKKLRIDMGLTQNELAQKIGISRSFYTNIENGKANPTLKTALKLKKVLDYSEDDIFFVSDVKEVNKK